ncbi:MAG: replication protein RepA [Sporichthyaceae bacterium]
MTGLDVRILGPLQVRADDAPLTIGPRSERSGMESRGGVRGDITRLREQMTRTLMATLVVADSGIAERDKALKFDLADHYELWWSKDDVDAEPLWPASIMLSERFYESVVSAPVPVDTRALKTLRGSPLRIDIYTWLTHRMSYLRRPTTVPWEALAVQFGGDYARLRAFKAVFLKQLDKVRAVYPFANVQQAEHGLLLLPSRPHVPPAPKPSPKGI